MTLAQIITSVDTDPIIDGQSTVIITFNVDISAYHQPIGVWYGYTPAATEAVPTPGDIKTNVTLTVIDATHASFTTPTLGVQDTTTGFIEPYQPLIADTTLATLQAQLAADTVILNAAIAAKQTGTAYLAKVEAVVTDENNILDWNELIGAKFAVTIDVPPNVPTPPTIESIEPMPLVAGVSQDLIGVDVGIATSIIVGYTYVDTDGNTRITQLTTDVTRVDQQHVTFTMPDLSILSTVNGFCALIYTINGETYSSAQFSIAIAPVSNVAPPATPPATTYGYGIPDEPMSYPVGRVPWVFIDPYDDNDDTNTYSFPINPNAMTSPFPTRTISASFTTAISGQTLLTEGAPKPSQWQFTGSIFNAAHYDALRSWVYERNRRIIVQDHFGRPITCVLVFFDAQPKQVQKKYWMHTYTITALVVDVGEPTQVPTEG